MANDPKLLWDKCLNIIQENVTEQQYTTWFKPITFQSYEKPALMVQVPSPFVYEYLEEHYVNLLRSVLIRVFGAGTQLMYRIEADKTNNITMDLEASKRAVSVSDCASTSKNIAITNPLTNVSNRDFCSQLNPNYNFENFIEGNSNKLTCSVGQAVAKQPAHTAFNPFFIFGPSGVGKTHLLNAIGIKIKELHPNLRVLYVSAHLFQVQYTDSVRNNTVNDFINFYQTIDVLLIDDIQEFTALTKTQNTFFHIFNHLHQNGRQLVLTSDRPPIALQGMEERLITRFKWGLLTELEMPDEELRKNILKSKIHRDGLHIPEDVIEFIATNVTDSVRNLEGVINSLMAYSVVYNCDIDLNLAQKVLRNAIKIEHAPLTVDLILRKTCEHFNVSQDDVFSATRKKAIVQVRQIAMYLAQKHTKLSTSAIGAEIGKRDHATVLHSITAVESHICTDKKFKAEVEAIDASLTNKTSK